MQFDTFFEIFRQKMRQTVRAKKENIFGLYARS